LSGKPSVSDRAGSWVHRPQRLKWRRALFQIHLWIAIALGLYIVVISVSGSVAVFRREASLWVIPRSVPSTAGERLTGDALGDAVRRVYAGYEVVGINDTADRPGRPDRANRPVDVAVVKNGVRSGRVFDPYAVEDMGDSYPPIVQTMEWFVDLHDNLLAGTTGRRINGIAGALIVLLVVTGAVIWWPGRGMWRHSLIVTPKTPRSRFIWQLHSALGFWSCGLLFIWAITAVYFAFPTPVEELINRFDPDPGDLHRPGEVLLLELIKLHFGRFGGLGIRTLWAILGLVPAALFITGFIVWWRRVVRPRIRRASA
jgi:uncharacterized iron-regulated membrane protein